MQFELYSSRVHEFEVRGRQNHPRHDGIDYAKGLYSSQWRLLGRYEAANTKGTQVRFLHAASVVQWWHKPSVAPALQILYLACLSGHCACLELRADLGGNDDICTGVSWALRMQAFRIAMPAWVKYLQLRFFSHHGAEAVCAINDVHVFGKSAADDLEDQLAMDSSRPPVAADPSPPVTPQQIASDPVAPVAVLPSRDANGSDASEPLQPVQPANATPASAPGGANEVVTPQPEPDTGPASLPAEPAPAKDSPPATTLPPPPSPTPSAESSTKPPAAPTALKPQPFPEPRQQVPRPSRPPTVMPPSALLPPTTPPHDPPQTEQQAQSDASSDDLLLLAGQGAKAKPSSVYDVLVAELRALKLQQKALPRAFAELERNVSAAMQTLGHALGALALDVSALQGWVLSQWLR